MEESDEALMKRMKKKTVRGRASFDRSIKSRRRPQMEEEAPPQTSSEPLTGFHIDDERMKCFFFYSEVLAMTSVLANKGLLNVLFRLFYFPLN